MEHIYFSFWYIICINMFMNYYKLFKYIPDSLGCKSCLSYQNLKTFYKVFVQLLQIWAIQLYNFNIIYTWNNSTQYYCKPWDKYCKRTEEKEWQNYNYTLKQSVSTCIKDRIKSQSCNLKQSLHACSSNNYKI